MKNNLYSYIIYIMNYLLLIYSCNKYLNKAEILFSEINNFSSNCKTYIIYGNPDLDSDYEIIDDKYLILKVEDSYEYLNKKTLILFKTIITLYPDITGILKCDDDIIPNNYYLNNFLNVYLNNNINIDYCGVIHTMLARPEVLNIYTLYFFKNNF